MAQEDELEAVAWMPLEEFASNPFMTSRPLFKVIIDKCVAYADGNYAGLMGQKLVTGFEGQLKDQLLLFGEHTEVGEGSEGGESDESQGPFRADQA